ncbi:MAG: DUF4347 domain-containing protein [Myxococcaceae bacterium]|nr:DUF4347 domain-containing protein [Myxococcaceae bacterium]MCI0668932.1 DUF4347 domain-containing protein [Myxococcaceae bacterium]
MHLVVISYPSRLDVRFEETAFAVHAHRGQPGRVFRRCQHPNQLRELAGDFPERVRLLDLVGHGAPGKLTLGDADAVTPDPSSWHLLEALGEHLAPDADVRLLGCDTGTLQQGYDVLRGLSRALEGRTVWGATAMLLSSDWCAEGLLPTTAAEYLVSSRTLVAPAAKRWRKRPPPDEEESVARVAAGGL